MKIQYDLKVIGVFALLTIVICAGIYLYIQWDLTRFKASLGEVPKFDSPTNIISQEEAQMLKPSADSIPFVTVEPELLPEVSTKSETTKTEMDIEINHTEIEDHIGESEILTFSTIEPMENISDEPIEPYDVEKVSVGFRNYNSFLSSNPEYAYASLTDALREQYGNYAEVDIIVETVRRVNNRAATFDDAISMREAMLRLTPPDDTTEIESLSHSIAALYELKALNAEGYPIKISFDIRFGE